MDSYSHNKFLKGLYKPYMEEMKYVLLRDISLFTILFAVCCFILPKYPILPYWFFPACFLFYVLGNYPIYIIPILIKIECKKHRFEKSTIHIVSMKRELTLAEHDGTSSLGRIYKKTCHMDRYIIKCENCNGKKYKMRAAMSGKKWQLLNTAVLDSKTCFTVTFGSLSHIIIHYDDKTELCSQLNHLY